MEKITVKDVKKHLSTKSKIKITGKKIFSLPKTMLNKTKQGYKNIKVKLNNFVEEEIKQEEKDKKVAKIDEKRKEQKEFIGQMEKQDEFRVGDKQYYLKAAKEELEKLNKKRIKRSKKGLGVFSLAKLTLVQIKKNTTTKINKIKEEKEQEQALSDKKEQKQILADNYKRSLELQKELLELQKENREILEQTPELNLYFNELVRENDNENEQSEEVSKGLH